MVCKMFAKKRDVSSSHLITKRDLSKTVINEYITTKFLVMHRLLYLYITKKKMKKMCPDKLPHNKLINMIEKKKKMNKWKAIFTNNMLHY